MESLKQVASDVFYLPGPANIGLIRGKNGLVIVDTGLDKTSGRKILQAASGLDLPVKAIINTHSHADHFGGNALLVARTGAKVFAPRWEEIVLRRPIWEPIFLFNGALPIRELREKFFQAEASPVDGLLENGDFEVDGITLKIVPLPGHSYEQAGVVYQDVLFSGDSIFAPKVLEKHQLPFGVDIGRWLETLRWLATTDYQACITGHGELEMSYQEAARRNIQWMEDLQSDLLGKIEDKPASAEELLQWLCLERDIHPSNPGIYLLLKTPLLAHLSCLQEMGQARCYMENGRLLWGPCNEKNGERP